MVDAGTHLRRKATRGPVASVVSLVVFLLAAVGYVAFLRPEPGFAERVRGSRTPPARPALDAFGRSGGVRMRFALPRDTVDFPLEIAGDPATLRYQWRPVSRGEATPPRDLSEPMIAPEVPGFYQLAVLTDSAEFIVQDPPLTVMVPFADKRGVSLNGYRIGHYRNERRRGADVPEGFVEIGVEDLNVAVSEHLRLADFVTRDGQTTWPRYAALDPRLLDKLELIFDEIRSWHGGEARTEVDVHSGFRTPLHNRRVARSARDSRHQLGDAIDLAIDADQNGVVNVADTRLIALAVEVVEREHPDLVGGLGIYTRGSAPYVHVDARGVRARWRG